MVLSGRIARPFCVLLTRYFGGGHTALQASYSVWQECDGVDIAGSTSRFSSGKEASIGREA